MNASAIEPRKQKEAEIAKILMQYQNFYLQVAHGFISNIMSFGELIGDVGQVAAILESQG